MTAIKTRLHIEIRKLLQKKHVSIICCMRATRGDTDRMMAALTGCYGGPWG